MALQRQHNNRKLSIKAHFSKFEINFYFWKYIFQVNASKVRYLETFTGYNLDNIFLYPEF